MREGEILGCDDFSPRPKTSPSSRATSPAAVGFDSPLLLAPLLCGIPLKRGAGSSAAVDFPRTATPSCPPPPAASCSLSPSFLALAASWISSTEVVRFCSLAATSSHASTSCVSFLMYHCGHQHPFFCRSDKVIHGVPMFVVAADLIPHYSPQLPLLLILILLSL